MTIMVHYPWLHPKLALLDGVPAALFDPGVAVETPLPRWRPQNLPLTNDEVRRLVREYLQFGERFAKPEDMGFFQVNGLEDFYSGTGLEFRSQLLAENDEALVDEDDVRRRQAQLVLALALFREEQYVALREQEIRFDGAREKFVEVLGLDDEEVFAELGAPTDDALFPRASVDLPWRALLEPLLCFLSDDASLYISDSDVLAEMQACGLSFSPCDIDGAAYVCCKLDENALILLTGKRIAARDSVRLVARPLNP